MRLSPEKLIARMRNKKIRIINGIILLIVFLFLITLYWIIGLKFWEHVKDYSEKDDLHHFFSHLSLLYLSRIYVTTILLSLFIGFLISFLIGLLFTYTKEDLLVELWDRVQTLEKARQDAANNQKPQNHISKEEDKPNRESPS
jgi:hypothetical protein